MSANKIKSTYKTRSFFNKLINTYGRKELMRIMNIGFVQFYRIENCYNGILPTKKHRRKLAELLNISFEEVDKLILPDEKDIIVENPNIREAVTSNAFYYDQNVEIFNSEKMTEDERFLITYYWMVKNEFKYINQLDEFEVLTEKSIDIAVKECEKEPDLRKNFLLHVGLWYKKNGRYFFQKNSSTHNGVRFLKDIHDLHIAKENRKFVSRQVSEVINYVEFKQLSNPQQ